MHFSKQRTTILCFIIKRMFSRQKRPLLKKKKERNVFFYFFAKENRWLKIIYKQNGLVFSMNSWALPTQFNKFWRRRTSCKTPWGGKTKKWETLEEERMKAKTFQEESRKKMKEEVSEKFRKKKSWYTRRISEEVRRNRRYGFSNAYYVFVSSHRSGRKVDKEFSPFFQKVKKTWQLFPCKSSVSSS